MYLYGIVIPEIMIKSDYDCMLPYVSKERRLHIERFHFEMDKKRSLFAELLLRYILNRHFSIADTELNFEKNKYGKPILSDYQDIFFNYSHSGSWVLCAVGGEPVGVDVEVIKAKDLDIAKRFFTSEEYRWLQSVDEKKRDECFYRLWTLKESYIKAEGKGLSIPLDSFSFHMGDSIELSMNHNIVDKYKFWNEKLDQDHMAALCYSGSAIDHRDIRINKISYEELLKIFIL